MVGWVIASRMDYAQGPFHGEGNSGRASILDSVPGGAVRRVSVPRGIRIEYAGAFYRVVAGNRGQTLGEPALLTRDVPTLPALIL